MAHRIRSIVPYLNYKELTPLLPTEKMFTAGRGANTAKSVACKGGKTPCPTLAKKLGASEYGCFVEKIIEVLLANECDIKSLNMTLDKDLQIHFKPEQYEPLANLLKTEFSNVEAQVALYDLDNNIVGHPDLLSYTTVYDIKTTGRFGAMRTSTIFQLLSYYCLCQINKLKVTHIGLILPLQLQI